MTELSGKVEELLNDARKIAEARRHAVVGTEHVLLAMTHQSVDAFARRLLDEIGATKSLRSRIEAEIGEGGRPQLAGVFGNISRRLYRSGRRAVAQRVIAVLLEGLLCLRQCAGMSLEDALVSHHAQDR